jgi:hypothetical protein
MNIQPFSALPRCGGSCKNPWQVHKLIKIEQFIINLNKNNIFLLAKIISK